MRRAGAKHEDALFSFCPVSSERHPGGKEIVPRTILENGQLPNVMEHHCSGGGTFVRAYQCTRA